MMSGNHIKTECNAKDNQKMHENNVNIHPSEQLLIVRLPLTLRGTYITWRMGFNPYFLMSRETYYRHAKVMKQKYGIDIKQEFKPVPD